MLLTCRVLQQDTLAVNLYLLPLSSCPLPFRCHMAHAEALPRNDHHMSFYCVRHTHTRTLSFHAQNNSLKNILLMIFVAHAEYIARTRVIHLCSTTAVSHLLSEPQ